MPIMEFDEIGELKKWIAEYPTVSRYAVITTAKRELIIRPTVSTKNLETGYFVAANIERIQEIVKDLQEQGYFVLKVRNYTWDEVKGPGGGFNVS